MAQQYGPPGATGSVRPSVLQSGVPTPQSTIDEVELQPPPPENVYPCGCPYPGTHKADCMWSLWEQMRDNYLQTKTLMGKFMSQMGDIQSRGEGGPECKCAPGCHGQDLGEALGMQQVQGVTLPWLQQGKQSASMPVATGGTAAPYQNQARLEMEEQRRVKQTWAQFLNIFDMALDLANDVSKDRWEANKRRKERARLEREEMLEQQRQERRERCSSLKSAQEEPKKKASQKKESIKEKKGSVQSEDRSRKSSKRSEAAAVQENEEPEEKEPQTEIVEEGEKPTEGQEEPTATEEVGEPAPEENN